MPNLTTRTAKSFWTGLRIMLILIVILGIAYPIFVLVIGQLAFTGQANGSLVRMADGRVAGSSLLGQRFEAPDGSPLPQYFQSRPSVAGDLGYDATASGGSNLGPESDELVLQISDRLAEVAAFNGVSESAVPVDAVTSSGSGLDPHISVEYAKLQVPRVAKARDLPVDVVEAAVDAATVGRDLGLLGEPSVNVVELNLALDAVG
ncbi:potassium-transporting ATPase subunit KdpC [Leucobacter coleopterorum]|uniref:Potassium-transporting ATPase KdpC subunit n=1 Tax=Leucobacter coleopterorum TaxID=2714933 RepID=A0ABX6JT64_9MICO|nr:potassium-transporting ATPase subunit KdpC [Leucobacter coleopterorum]QIM17496.1 potassium-transporting ATPase subunit KdpC [Leucobacter coleopterorum]